MEDTDEDQRCRKLPRIYELLQMIHSKLQPYSETIKQTKGNKRMGVERRTSTSLQQTQRQDNKSTSTFSSEERRKI